MTIQVEEAPAPSDDAAIAALMTTLVPDGQKDEDEPDDDGDEPGDDVPGDEADDDGDDSPDDDADDAADDDDEDEPEGDDKTPKETPVADDAVVQIEVGGEVQEVTVGDLKRLAAEQDTVSQKSAEADLVGQRAAAVLQGALDVVLEDLAVYQDIDWTLEGSRMDPDDYEYHRTNFTRLEKRLGTILEGAKSLEGTVKARQDANLQREAEAAVKVLSDPKQGIEGWGDALYGNIIQYAVEAGLPNDDVARITNPSIIKIINKARLYDEAQRTSAEKVNLTPKRVRKGESSEGFSSAKQKQQKALERKLKSGTATDEDAIAVLVGRWR